MNKPRICAVIVNNDLPAVKEIEPLVDLLEVRIDLIGDEWKELVMHLDKPWLACNRSAREGGSWLKGEEERIEELLQAPEWGADIVDIELNTENLDDIVSLIKKSAKCLLSYHNMEKTPELDDIKEIVNRQIKSGADICKVITTAKSIKDNWKTLRLISEFPHGKLVSFAMGSQGMMSRVLCPLVGGEFTYASIATGKESAQGQMTVQELNDIYKMVTG